jgi:SAM-dependent methyltransferase
MRNEREESTDELPVQADYAAWASCYDDEGNPLTALEGPAVRAWFGPLEGRRALDLGCGTGRYSFALTESLPRARPYIGQALGWVACWRRSASKRGSVCWADEPRRQRRDRDVIDAPRSAQ